MYPTVSAIDRVSGSVRSGVVTGLILLTLGAAAMPVRADTVTVAVASNFLPVARQLASQFQSDSGHSIRLAQGSTGQHYAQILQGAPFDLFLAADAERPERLENEGIAVAGSRVSYASGRLVLWVPDATVEEPARMQLENRALQPLALANPRLAPYGAAADAVLAALGLSTDYQEHRVEGNNIAQTWQFVATGNAPGGFVSRSQVVGNDLEAPAFWDVPVTLHPPIDQQMVLLQDTLAARAFWRFLQSPEARTVIRQAGYGEPLP